ncbi:hypothetical protein J4E91_005730 [Alternaria rosae]|nr:hypothetical protein J4E91_005730 [Alternaria rosae]
MAPLTGELIVHKQEKFNNAAVAAIKAHYAHSQVVPEQAKLNYNDKTVIENGLGRFDPPAPKSSNFDLKVAEAAGFHRAMNLWNETCGFGPLLMSPGVKGALSAQPSILGGLLRNCQVDIDEPSSFPSEFKDQSAESGIPYRLVKAHDEAENEALTLSYYDVYMEMVC